VRPNPGMDDSRIRWVFLPENVGQAAARNQVLNRAQGEYIAFVDSDDEVVPDIYRRCLEQAKRTHRDIVAFGIRTIYEAERLRMDSEFSQEDIGLLTPHAMAKFVALRLFDEPVNKIYRRLFLKANKICFPPGICPGEDAMFNLSCVMAGATYATVAGIGYFYYRQDGTTLSRYQPRCVETLALWKERWDKYLSGVGKGYSGWWPTKDYSPEWVAAMQWENLWRRGTTVSLAGRWRYLKANPSLCHPCALMAFVRKYIYTFLRLHCYWRLVRRRHLKQTWPSLQDVTEI